MDTLHRKREDPEGIRKRYARKRQGTQKQEFGNAYALLSVRAGKPSRTAGKLRRAFTRPRRASYADVAGGPFALQDRTSLDTAALRAFQFLKGQIQDRIFGPVPVIEVPPFEWVDGESMLFHRPYQKIPVFPFLGDYSRVAGIGALGEFIVAASHRHGLARFQTMQGQVHGRAPVVPGPGGRIGHKLPQTLGRALPEHPGHIPGAVGVEDRQPKTFLLQLPVSQEQGFGRRPLEPGFGLSVERGSHEVVRSGVPNVESQSRIQGRKVDQFGFPHRPAFNWRNRSASLGFQLLDGTLRPNAEKTGF